jgi:hypothetical protein
MAAKEQKKFRGLSDFWWPWVDVVWPFVKMKNLWNLEICEV